MELVPYRLAVSCWHGVALTLALILFGHKKRTQGGREGEARRLILKDLQGQKAFTVCFGKK